MDGVCDLMLMVGGDWRDGEGVVEYCGLGMLTKGKSSGFVVA